MTSPGCPPCWTVSSRSAAVDHHAVELDQPQRAVAAHRIEAGDIEAALVEIANGVDVTRHPFVDADHRRLGLQRSHSAEAVAAALQHLDIEAMGIELEIGAFEAQLFLQHRQHDVERAHRHHLDVAGRVETFKVAYPAIVRLEEGAELDADHHVDRQAAV